MPTLCRALFSSGSLLSHCHADGFGSRAPSPQCAQFDVFQLAACGTGGSACSRDRTQLRLLCVCSPVQQACRAGPVRSVLVYSFVTKACVRRPGVAASVERRRRERRTLLAGAVGEVAGVTRLWQARPSRACTFSVGWHTECSLALLQWLALDLWLACCTSTVQRSAWTASVLFVDVFC